MDNRTYLQFKLVLLGQAGVGKSNLVLRFVKNEFNPSNESTIGAAFLTQTVALNNQTVVKFEIWDTAGQERFNSLAPMYYRGAQAALVVYDITNDSSFTRAKSWVKELQTKGTAKMVIALVGNKNDMEENRRVQATEAQSYAEENGILFMETSAKTGVNVAEIFEQIAKTLPKEKPSGAKQPYLNLNDQETSQSNNSNGKPPAKGGCCG
eukprot:TRINITY_DN12450_c0_g1_i1.p1 TRINITY_DN12450_c0_g1~~TRINITY_DN12450_c0_g1_i1.p1  ORF type:complete len:209 (-),score=55.78 TRINITY_DN12450_c0_g1_i1:141-767(-)